MHKSTHEQMADAKRTAADKHSKIVGSTKHHSHPSVKADRLAEGDHVGVPTPLSGTPNMHPDQPPMPTIMPPPPGQGGPTDME